MFKFESQMTKPADMWLCSQGLVTKKEFSTPWGICDLVGCSLNKTKIKKRLKYGQTKSIASQLRVMILSLIPDVDKGTSVTCQELQNHFAEYFDCDRINLEIDRLVKDKFIVSTPQGNLQKQNGWMPLQKKILSLELKLTRVNDALHQAINNLEFADESYVGLPMQTAIRVVHSEKKAKFSRCGIGILGISPQECKVLLRSNRTKAKPNEIMQAHCVERFWSNYSIDN